MREPESIFERGLGSPIRNEIEDAQPLDRARRSIDPGIVFPGAIVGGMPYTDSQDTCRSRGGTAGPSVEPDVTHVSGVVTRGDVSVGRGEYGDAAAIEFRRDRAIADVSRPPVGSA